MSWFTTDNVHWLVALAVLVGCSTVTPTQAQNVDVVNSHLAPWVGKHLDGKTPCKSTAYIPGGGPFDYLKLHENAGRLNMVENAHFPTEVEQLIKGKTGSVMADIDFVLRTFPNHHRALNSAMEYSLRYQKWPKDHHGLPAECYLQRAINFRPADGVNYRIFGYYLQKKGKFKEALEANELALKFFPADVMVRYNTGLILVALKRYEEAMTYAKPLYEAGLTLPGLKNKLQRAGHWKPTQKEQDAIAAFMKASAKANAATEDAATTDSAANTELAQSNTEAEAETEASVE